MDLCVYHVFEVTRALYRVINLDFQNLTVPLKYYAEISAYLAVVQRLRVTNSRLRFYQIDGEADSSTITHESNTQSALH